MAFSFDEAYKGTPPWDIGRPQPEFVRLVRDGEVRGRVLDVGCGTGENAIYFATNGLDVWGLDSAPLAIKKARKKAEGRKVRVNFVVGDALHLERLGVKFDTITDCGLFHVFSDESRNDFDASLKRSLKPTGRYLMMCFSDKEPNDWGGPRRVSKEEIVRTFGQGWRVDYVREARFSTNFDDVGGRAWLSSISRAAV